jgi:hypothetical protein
LADAVRTFIAQNTVITRVETPASEVAAGVTTTYQLVFKTPFGGAANLATIRGLSPEHSRLIVQHRETALRLLSALAGALSERAQQAEHVPPFGP